MPLPIFTAIQHEIPLAPAKALQEVREQRDYLIDSSRYEILKKEEEELESKTRWLWFEFTPYEVGCDELGVSCVDLVALFDYPAVISQQAWIPSWSLGRRFENGKNIERRVSETISPGSLLNICYLG